MRYTQFRAFQKHLHSSSPDHISALYCIVSGEEDERSLALAELKKALKNPPLIQFGGDRAKEALAALNTPGLFETKEIIHLHSLEKIPKKEQGELLQAFSSIRPGVTLVLSGETLSKASHFYKGIETHGILLDFVEEKPWEREKGMLEWLALESTQAKVSVSKEAARLLANGTLGKYSHLKSEWEKLLLYTDGKGKIELEDVLAISTLQRDDTTFALSDAIASLDAKKALLVATRLLQQGNSVFSLLRQIRSKMQMLLLACEGQEAEVIQKYPYLRGQLLEKLMADAKGFGAERASMAIKELDAFEFAAKDGLDDEGLLFLLLIGKITTDTP